MKKVFFVALVAALGTATVNAQFEKGVKTLNVKTSGLDLKTYSVEGNSETKLNLAAEGSYFIIDQLAIAAEVGVESLKEFGDDEAITTIFLGAGARYYLSPKGWFAGARLVGYGGESRISAVSGIMEGGYT
ncbi:MAG: hypothetical protein LBL42_02720, partial [Tannerella sp.]|nr:hypothetical protein [Tannerella sp.]